MEIIVGGAFWILLGFWSSYKFFKFVWDNNDGIDFFALYVGILVPVLGPILGLIMLSVEKDWFGDGIVFRKKDKNN